MTLQTRSALVPCAHCHERHPSVRLYRISGGHTPVLIRPICQPCFEALDRLGMSIRAAS